MENNLEKTKQLIIWTILDHLVSWRKFLIILTSIFTIIALAVAFLLPKEYKATARVLPSLRGDILGTLGGSSLSGLAKDLTPLMNNKFNISTGYNYLSILNSNRALTRLIDQYDLMKVYSINDSSYEKTLKELRSNFVAEIDEYGTVEISIYDCDRYRAAQMANSLVEILNDITRELATLDAKNNREFIERRLENINAELKQVEDSLKAYQEKSGFVMTPEQSSALLAIADLYGMKAKKEVEFAILEKTVTSDNDLLKQLKVELKELDKKISSLPSIGLTSIRLYRNVLIRQKIVEYLFPLYEQAKLQEVRDTPTVLVLDKAVPPEKKVRPPRLLIILSGFVLGLLISSAFCLILEKWISYPNDSYSELQKKVKIVAYRVKSKLNPRPTKTNL